MKFLVNLQYLIPKTLLSRLVAKLANCRNKVIKNLFIYLYSKFYRVNMQEALEPDLHKYSNFNNFFTRALKPEARPIHAEPQSLIFPADGAVSQFGKITAGKLIQAKGFDFSLSKLLGDDENLAAKFNNGNFITVYLSPRDYHRVHMPCTGELQKMLYVPGALFSVNAATAKCIPNLFARNERVISVFKTDFGFLAMILVGACIVAGIETVWAGPIAPNAKKTVTAWDYQEQNIMLQRSDEMGRFKMGSTVILLFSQSNLRFKENLQLTQVVKFGELMGHIL